MGRCYSGDIHGKFWFAVQSSDDALFFGGKEYQPNYIEYYFSKENDIESIREGIDVCKKNVQEYKEKLDLFFSTHDGYNDEMISNELNISNQKVEELLKWYARLELGENILKCVEENGECRFEAEI